MYHGQPRGVRGGVVRRHARGGSPRGDLQARCGDNVRSAVAAVARGWGVHVLKESSEGLVDTNMRMDLLMRAAGECRGFIAVDITRRFDATREALRQAEAKTAKY